MPSPLARAEAAWLTEPEPEPCVCGHGWDGHTTLGACEWCGCMDFAPGAADDADHGYDLWKDDVL